MHLNRDTLEHIELGVFDSLNLLGHIYDSDKKTVCSQIPIVWCSKYQIPGLFICLYATSILQLLYVITRSEILSNVIRSESYRKRLDYCH